MGRYGCCGGGKDVDREALAKLSEAKMREVYALAVSHTQQAEREVLRRQDWHIRRLREALEMIASPGATADYGWWTERARKALSPAPDGSQEGR